MSARQSSECSKLNAPNLETRSEAQRGVGSSSSCPGNSVPTPCPVLGPATSCAEKSVAPSLRPEYSPTHHPKGLQGGPHQVRKKVFPADRGVSPGGCQPPPADQGWLSLEFPSWFSRLRTQHSVHEDAAFIPGFSGWVKDLALPEGAA